MLPRIGVLSLVWFLQSMTCLMAQTDSTDILPGSALTQLGRIAVRTNLLRWLTFTSEVGVIWHVAPQWDVQFDVGWTSATWQYHGKRYALWFVSPEVRRYLDQHNRYYVGMRVETGQRHYKWEERGYVGWVWGAGVTTGYLWHISQRTGIDFHIGAGFDAGRLKEYDLDKYYDEQDPERTYRGTDWHQYYGINHLGISILWQL